MIIGITFVDNRKSKCNNGKTKQEEFEIMNFSGFFDKVSSEFNRLGAMDASVHSWVVAYSGGVDSRVLLHVAAKLKPEHVKKIKVVHVNHGLSDFDLDWEESAKEVCSRYEVDLSIERVTLAKGASEEKMARDARYSAISKYVEQGSFVFMGHHLNDNIETFMFRLFRGTGLNGLRCIPEKRSFACGFIVRPFLSLDRKSIEEFALSSGLEWVTDESNIDTKYSRNFIRHKILPVVLERYSDALNVINRTIKQFKEAQSLLDEIAECDMKSVAADKKITKGDGVCLDLSKLKELSKPRAKNVIIKFFSLHSDLNQESKRLDNLMNIVYGENKNNSKLKKIEYSGFVILTNGRVIWCEKR